MLLNERGLKVMEEFLRDYNARITGSFIARKRRLNQKSVSNFLKQLEKENFLKSTTQGKNKLYFLNLEDELNIASFISCFEHIRTIRFYRKKPFIKEVAGKIIPLCSGIIAVFGSYAKGAEKEDSDIDLFVAGKCDVDKIQKISEMYHIEINVKHYASVPKRSDLLIEEIIKDHVIINDIHRFVWMVLKWKKSSGVFA